MLFSVLIPSLGKTMRRPLRIRVYWHPRWGDCEPRPSLGNHDHNGGRSECMLFNILCAFFFKDLDSFFGTASNGMMMLLLDISRRMFSTHFSYLFFDTSD